MKLYTIKQAGKDAVKLEQSNGMQRILQANVRKTCQELDNLTMTTAVKTQSAFIQACNKAQMKVSTLERSVMTKPLQMRSKRQQCREIRSLISVTACR